MPWLHRDTHPGRSGLTWPLGTFFEGTVTITAIMIMKDDGASGIGVLAAIVGIRLLEVHG
jgi:hypothetical protein